MKEQELPELPEAVYFGYESDYEYTEEQVQAYGAACAAHARELALEEAKEAIESANARRVLYVPDCIDVIEALKGK